MTRKILTLVVWLASSALAADDPVMRAMRDELARSIKKLQLKNLQKPYFIAYRALETAFCSVNASFGALTSSACEPPAGTPRTRMISVEVRVGDYNRDNTNFFAPMAVGGVVRPLGGGGLSFPIDDNYDEIRRQLWLGTDSAYKNALDAYAKKKAALENRKRTDDAPDFSHEPMVTFDQPAPVANWNRTQIENLVKSLSLLFRETPGIDDSELRFSANTWLTRYVNSEGSSFTRPVSYASLTIAADTQATDGMPLSDFEVIHARSFQDLPPRDEIVKRIRALQARQESLRKAPLVERYTGPVLFEGQAAAELLLQGLGSALVGVPRVVVEDPRFERAFTANGGFADKIGGRVLPDSFGVIDNPAARDFQGQPFYGGYPVDDDGVLAKPTVLVENGILKTLLHGRGLIPGTTASTASRRGTGPSPSNLLFTADKGLPPDRLKAELIRVAQQRGKEYGIVARRIGNPMLAMTFARGRARTIIMTGGNGPGSIDVEPLIEAYKVYRDGREELVRNLSINGLTLGAFKDVIATSDTPFVYTAPLRLIVRSPAMAQMFAAPGGPNVVSAAVPSLLFEDMTLQRPTGDIPNVPFTKHPFFDGK